jgi:hypothetical protein
MIIQGLTNSFRSEMLQGVHDLSTDTLKLALYTSGATLLPTTTVYSSTDEVVASGYTAGGATLTNVTISTQANVPNTQPAVVYVDFDDVTFNAALTARGALIYNASKANRSIAVLNFGSDKTSTTTFTVQMPQNTATDALIRFP